MDTPLRAMLLTLVVHKQSFSVEAPSLWLAVHQPSPLISGCSRLEEYGIYATSGLPLTYSTNNASVLAVDSATGKLDPKGAGTVTITISQAGDSHFSAARMQP